MTDDLMKISGALFTLSMESCSCLLDIIHDDEGKETYTFRIGEVCGYTHLYAYAAQSGLVEINPKTGAIIPGNNLTDDFLSLNLKDVKAIAEFMHKYGSFVSFPPDKYSSISYTDLYVILRRFQLVVRMITAINSSNFDYIELCNDMLLLNFGKYHRVSLIESGDYLETCKHPITVFWYERDAKEIFHYLDPDLRDMPSYVLDEEIDEYDVNDTFLQKHYYIDYNEPTYEFEIYMSETDIKNDPWARGLQKLHLFFRSSYPFDENTKLLIDFVSNIAMQNEHYLEWRNGAFRLNESYIKASNSSSDESKFTLTERHKEVILQLCRNTIKEEFDAALMQVHPSYNAVEMMPSWKIPNLYTALYFSIFYTNPNYEIYRKCANPGCHNVFLVRTSNTRKRYCCLSCQNMAAQARHRSKVIKKGAT